MIDSIKRKRYLLFFILSIFIFMFSTNLAKAETRSIDELRYSVVRIICYGPEGEVYTGTGFAVGVSEPVRHIVTNFHVVEPNLEGVTILLSKEDQIAATVVAFDKVKDIAVLELQQDLYKRPPMELGDSDEVIPSQDVYALGFPGDADLMDDTPSGDPDDVTITRGIISKISTQGGRGIFQVDVSINPGNSGGPLLNEQGQVIGINTFAVTSASGINGVVKIDELLPILDSRGIEYLTADSAMEANNNNALFWIIVLVFFGFIILLIFVILYFLVFKKKKTNVPNKEVQALSHEHSQKAVLKGISGYFANEVIELDQNTLTIGRDVKYCQLIFPHTLEEISRKHCTIRFDKNNRCFTIEDFSTNGTYLLSGERIPHGKLTQLQSGDRFYLSSKENLFEVRWESR